MKKALRSLLALLLVGAFAFTLVGCGGRNGDDETTDTGTQQQGNEGGNQTTTPPTTTTGGDDDEGYIDEVEEEQYHPGLRAISARFPSVAVRDGATFIEGGELRVALVWASPLEGTIGGNIFSSDTAMSFVQSWMMAGVLNVNPDFTLRPAIGYEKSFDIDAQTITLTQVADIYWHDGVPKTMRDIYFAIHTIADPDYLNTAGIRWDTSNRNIVGAEAFHRGETDSIEGLTLSADNRTLTWEFYTFSPATLQFWGWTSPMPEHIFGGMTPTEMALSDWSRGNPATGIMPIGTGPFIVNNVVAGESVHFIRNENFHLGVPYLESVEVVRVESANVLPFMEAGLFDVVNDFPVGFFVDNQNPTNFSYLGVVGNIFSYFAFRLGHFDDDYVDEDGNTGGRNVQVRDTPLQSRYLRQAMGYGYNEQEIVDILFHGLRLPATSIIPPGHSWAMDLTLEGFRYDPDHARDLLRQGGFIDIDGDGFVEDPDGNQMTLYVSISEGVDQDILAQYMIESWERIGIRVELYQGRLQEFTANNNAMTDDSWPNVDIFFGAWSAGANPSPGGLWGPTSRNNRARHNIPRLNAIIDNIESPRGFTDREWLVEQFHDYQELFHYYAPAIPTNWRLTLNAVNNRVHGWANTQALSFDPHELPGWHEIRLTRDTRY